MTQCGRDGLLPSASGTLMQLTAVRACRAHAARFEKEFFDDLDALGVRPPHAIPRITDHMPQIIAYIERLEGLGFAYAGGGGGDAGRSVYFDVAAFRKAGHRYGKLEPWKVGTAELASEGESDFGAREKRSDQVRYPPPLHADRVDPSWVVRLRARVGGGGVLPRPPPTCLGSRVACAVAVRGAPLFIKKKKKVG